MFITFSKLILFILAGTSPLSAHAQAPVSNSSTVEVIQSLQDYELERSKRGGVGDGGGDSEASEFLEYGRQAVAWLFKNPHSNLPVDEYELTARILKIYRSIDKARAENSEVKPLLIMLPLSIESIDCPTPKKACSYSDGSIQVAGGYWYTLKKDNDHLARCTLAMTELLRTQSVPRLYERAPELCQHMSVNGSLAIGEDHKPKHYQSTCLLRTAETPYTFQFSKGDKSAKVQYFNGNGKPVSQDLVVKQIFQDKTTYADSQFEIFHYEVQKLADGTRKITLYLSASLSYSEICK